MLLVCMTSLFSYRAVVCRNASAICPTVFVIEHTHTHTPSGDTTYLRSKSIAGQTLAGTLALFEEHNSNWPAAARKNFAVPGFTVVACDHQGRLAAAAVVQRSRGQPAFTIRLAVTRPRLQRSGFMKIVVAAIHQAAHTRAAVSLFVEVAIVSSQKSDSDSQFRWEDAFGFTVSRGAAVVCFGCAAELLCRMPVADAEPAAGVPS